MDPVSLPGGSIGTTKYRFSSHRELLKRVPGAPLPFGPRQRRLDISPGSGLHPFLRWPILKGEVADQGRELLHLVDYLSNGVGRKYGMRLTLLRSSGATKYERNNYLSSIRNFELMCPCERYTHQDYNGRKNELNYWGVVPLKG
jgi:hypothetical protein